jgi:HAD superfamily hydrolase (TIGR01509 family)
VPLKAVLFNFNGVIINDEAIHQQLISDLLLGENLRPSLDEYKELCVGRSDRACLADLLSRRGRVVTQDYLTQLVEKKFAAYRQQLETLETLPIYPGLDTLIDQLQTAGVATAIVSGALRVEVELVLERAGLQDKFRVIVAGDEVSDSKPKPAGYLLGVQRLNQAYPDLYLEPKDCLVIEDTLVGITAAKAAGMQVVGVANTYPFHMLQRQANWTVDYLSELELDRIQAVLA